MTHLMTQPGSFLGSGNAARNASSAPSFSVRSPSGDGEPYGVGRFSVCVSTEKDGERDGERRRATEKVFVSGVVWGVALSARARELSKNKPVVLYCRSGARSASAKRLLETLGFTDVYDAGGMHRLG